MSVDKKEWQRFINQARMKLPGASDAGLKGELFDTLNDFFGQSSVWLENIDFNVVPNVVDYDLGPSDGGQIIRLMNVVNVSNVGQPALMPELGKIILSNIPAAPAVYTVTVAKNVALPTDEDSYPIVPDWVISVYGTGILDGLLGRMMTQIAKSYSNATQGMFHLKKFQSAITGARIAALRANTLGTQAWGYPQAYRTRGQKGGISTGNAGRF
jgi:hypothetical protein